VSDCQPAGQAGAAQGRTNRSFVARRRGVGCSAAGRLL